MDAQVQKAIQEYDRGDFPWGTPRPRNWFLVAGSGKLYPAKYIWGLIINAKPEMFHTTDAVTGLTERGCLIVEKNALPGFKPDDFDDQVAEALELSDDELRKRLKGTGAPPQRQLVATHQFARNPYVAAATLRRAKGRCEECGQPAPFTRRSNGEPYLEVHHRVFLADGGDDSLDNTMALCPNCHRKAHYGQANQSPGERKGR